MTAAGALIIAIRTRILTAATGATQVVQARAAIGQIPPVAVVMTGAAIAAATIMMAEDRAAAVIVEDTPARVEAAVVLPVGEEAATNMYPLFYEDKGELLAHRDSYAC